MGHFKKCSEVLIRSLEIEAANEASKRHSKVYELKAVDKEEAITEITKTVVAEVKKLLAESSTRKLNRSLECWNCGREGHLRSQCRQPPKNKEN